MTNRWPVQGEPHLCPTVYGSSSPTTPKGFLEMDGCSVLVTQKSNECNLPKQTEVTMHILHVAWIFGLQTPLCTLLQKIVMCVCWKKLVLLSVCPSRPHWLLLKCHLSSCRVFRVSLTSCWARKRCNQCCIQRLKGQWSNQTLVYPQETGVCVLYIYFVRPSFYSCLTFVNLIIR